LLPSSAGPPSEKKPWSTPTVEEVPRDTLPTEVRMLELGPSDADLPPQVDAVADVPHQVETQPPADHYAPGGLMDYVNGVIEEQLRNLDGAKKVKREASAEEKQPIEPPAADVVSAADPAPATPVSAPKPMLEGDRIRAENRARNEVNWWRHDAEIRGRSGTNRHGS
jgi:hypothetical protein